MKPDPSKLAVLATALAVTVLLLVTAAPAAGDQAFGTLALSPMVDSLCVRSGQPVVVRMNIAGLTQEVKACQAFLGYDSSYLSATAVAPGGGDWDDLIYERLTLSGKIDTAIGVLGETRLGTMADGTVAVIAMVAGPREGFTRLVFRPDVSDVESTFLSDMLAGKVWPVCSDSPTIVIDNTAPNIAITAVRQNGQELPAGGWHAIQGAVNITVTAHDSLSGLSGPPAVTVTPFGGAAQTAALVNESPAGVFNYTWTVTAATANGTAEVNATVSDRSGNPAAAAPRSFTVNKNRISGRLEMQGFVGSSRTVLFTATGLTSKTWSVLVTGFQAGMADYQLDDVPDGVTGLSAKTSWSLRRKLSLGLDGQGQALGYFTDASKLLGGDLNASNLVNIQDYTIMKLHWLTADAVGDINDDGIVNVLDYTIMKLNWLKDGDPE